MTDKFYVCEKCRRPGDKASCPCGGTAILVNANCGTVKDKLNVGLNGLNPGTTHEVTISIEGLQDLHILQREMEAFKTSEPTEEEIKFWNAINDRGFFGKIRTPEPTAEEIAGWREDYEKLKTLDIDKAKEKYGVYIIRDGSETFYEMWGTEDYTPGKTMAELIKEMWATLRKKP